MLLLTVLLLLAASLMAQARLTLIPPVVANRTAAANVSVSTQEFFQQSVGVQEPRSGPVHLLPLQVDPATGQCIPPSAALLPASSDIKRINTTKHTESIIVVEWIAAPACGVQTLTQLIHMAQDFNATLRPAGLLPSRTIVILLPHNYPGTPGNPLQEPYLSHDIRVPDGIPDDRFYVALVTKEDTQVIERAVSQLGVGGDRAILSIEPEQGPWNELFLLPTVRLVFLCLFALNLTFILFSAGRLGLVIFRGEFSFNTRNIIYLIGFVGTTLYSATLILPIQSFASKIIEMTSSWLNSIAFHILLYLWSVFVMQVRYHRSVYWLRGFIVFGALCTTFFFVYSLVAFTTLPTETLALMNLVIGYWMPITQGLLAIVFLGYALKFRQSQKHHDMTSATASALQRLQILAAIAFLTYIAIALTNLRVVTVKMITPQTFLSVVLLRVVSSSVRGLALICVLGVRMPRRHTLATVQASEFKTEQTLVQTDTSHPRLPDKRHSIYACP